MPHRSRLARALAPAALALLVGAGPAEAARDDVPIFGGAEAEPEEDRPFYLRPGREENGPAETEDDGASAPAPPSPAEMPEPSFGEDGLPAPVALMRRRLLDAAMSGDLDAVARLADPGPEGTELSLVPEGQSPREQLLEQSGDEEGHEILAILAEILEAGHVVFDKGEADELYVWPWFAAAPLDRLSPSQRVAMFRILTAADLEASEELGAYVFYRVGIDRDGRWRFFVSGD